MDPPCAPRAPGAYGMEEGQSPKGKGRRFQGKGERVLNNRHCGHSKGQRVKARPCHPLSPMGGGWDTDWSCWPLVL